MLEIQLGDTLEADFTTHNDAGANVNADATPTFTVYKNGSAVVALTNQNATNYGTGLYRCLAAITAAAGFASGDKISVVVTSTVGGDTSTIVLKVAHVVAWRTVDGLPLSDAIASILGAIVGVRNVSDNTITFYGRDGTTLLGTLTIGDVAGVIETSVLTAD